MRLALADADRPLPGLLPEHPTAQTIEGCCSASRNFALRLLTVPRKVMQERHATQVVVT